VLTLGELIVSVYGASLLARFNPRGMSCFDTSLGGFWRSFYAAALVAPLYALVVLMRPAEDTVPVPLFRFLVVEASTYVIHWVAFPLLMVNVARMIDREERYLGYIVAYNWSAFLQNLVFLPLTLLAMAGTFGEPAGSLLSALALGVILAIDWFVTRTALQVGGAGAAALVLLALGVDLLVGAASESLLHG
jgi:hypothetical protein